MRSIEKYKTCDPIYNRGYRRRREREGDQNVFEEIMAKSFPNLKKETYIKVQEAQRVPDKMNANRPTQIYHNSSGKSER